MTRNEFEAVLRAHPGLPVRDLADLINRSERQVQKYVASTRAIRSKGVNPRGRKNVWLHTARVM